MGDHAHVHDGGAHDRENANDHDVHDHGDRGHALLASFWHVRLLKSSKVV